MKGKHIKLIMIGIGLGVLLCLPKLRLSARGGCVNGKAHGFGKWSELAPGTNWWTQSYHVQRRYCTNCNIEECREAR